MKKAIIIFQFLTITIGIIVITLFLIPRLFGIKPFVVLSGSMEEAILTGSVIYVNTNIKAEDIKVGDVIAFNAGEKQVTHRVISINSDNTFTTKGDANKFADINPVRFSNYMGKTVYSIPFLGYIASVVQTKIGYAILILLIGLDIVSLIFLMNDGKPNKSDKNKVSSNNKKRKLKEQNI